MKRLGCPLLNVFGFRRPYATGGKRSIQNILGTELWASNEDDASPPAPLEYFRIDAAKLSLPELATLSGVSVSSVLKTVKAWTDLQSRAFWWFESAFGERGQTRRN